MRSPIASRRRAAPLVAATAFLVAGAAAFLAAGAARAQAPVDDETCLDCHEDIAATLEPTPHRLAGPDVTLPVAVHCTSCHAGGEAHVDDPSPETMTTPAELAGRDVVAVCTQCHPAHDDLDGRGFDAHTVERMSCADCHRVHGGDARLLLDDDAAFCLRCHDEIGARLRMVSNHPVLERTLTCLSCHRFVKRGDPGAAVDAFAGGPSRCRDCHPEQGGPFPFEHEAVNAYSLEGSGGCIECHDPHGSENDRLLRQPGNRLCRQCHFPAGHETEHGGIWAQFACQQCHVDTHGSFVSRRFLDPNLPAKFGGDCYDAGCHGPNP